MRLMKLIFISLAVAVIMGLGGYFGYQAAYAMGETAGYDTGYPEGEEAGYISGKQAGYDEGYSTGEQTGYDEGYTTGEQAGYDEGYTTGEQAGYDEGYSSGRDDGYSSGETEGYISGTADGYATGYDEGLEDGLGHGYTLKDPTYTEVVAFLRDDKTDKNEYVEDTYGVYVCSHFARDVCNNAEQAGLRCAFVELRYLEGGHAIVAFNTTDKGLVYFEPISDEESKPVIGKHYYLCIVPKAGYYYEKPSYDDTIMDIVVIW